MKSSVKRLYSLILSFAFVCLALLSSGLFSFAQPTLVVSAEESQIKTTKLFDYVSITQEGKTFSDADLQNIETNKDTNTEYNGSATLYANKTVTFTIPASNVYDNIDFSTTSGVSYVTTTIETITYYTFPLPAEDTSTSIEIKLSKTIKAPNNNGYITSYPLEFSLTLIQTTTDFTQNIINFTQTKEGNTVTSHTLSEGETYEIVELTTKAGSALNPIYVEFVYNGEKYALKNTDDTFSPVSQAIESAPEQASTVITDNFPKIVFHKYGIYQLKIYDNFNPAGQTFNFFINKTTGKFSPEEASSLSPLFTYAKTSDGQLIMDGQFVNSAVTLYLGNLNAQIESQIGSTKRIYNYIGKIEILRTETKQNSNDTITTTYTNATNAEHKIKELVDMYSDSESNTNQSNSALSFSNDGNYEIKIYTETGDTPIHFSFSIVRNIKSSFAIAGTTLLPEGQNSITEHKVYDTASKKRSYNFTDLSTEYAIPSYTSYSFNVKIAQSAPAITGNIANGQKTTGSVSLKVNGVGKIAVNVTQDGELIFSKTLKNGDALPTYSKIASYTVTMVDEMGMSASLSFKITESMNTASIILIIVAVVGGVFLIIFIIRARSKIKVR